MNALNIANLAIIFLCCHLLKKSFLNRSNKCFQISIAFFYFSKSSLLEIKLLKRVNGRTKITKTFGQKLARNSIINHVTLSLDFEVFKSSQSSTSLFFFFFLAFLSNSKVCYLSTVHSQEARASRLT